MKVLHVIPSLHKGGAERLCLDIVRALRAQPGVEAAEVAVLADGNEYASEYPDIKPMVVRSRVVPSISGKWQVDLKDWNDLLESFNPDIIHSHLFEADLLTRYRVLEGKKYISHCHDNMHQLARLKPGEWFNKKRLTEAYERRFMLGRYKQSQNTFMAISRDTEEYFKAVLPKNLAQRVHYLPNAIDVARFSKNCAQTPSGGAIRLVNVGSFIALKNQTFLLDVLAELLRMGQPAEMVFAGDGPLLETVKQKAVSTGLENHVVFLGKASGVENHLWQSHVYVHAATREAFGLAIAEALAAGLPVVCLDAKGNRELVIDGQNGYLITEPDARLFAEKIKSVGTDAERWKNMSAAAVQKASAYDIHPYVNRLLELYRH